MLHAYLSAHHKLVASFGGCESEIKAAKSAKTFARALYFGFALHF